MYLVRFLQWCYGRSSRSCTWRNLSPTLFSSGGSFTNCGWPIEHAGASSHFQKILTDLLSIGENVEEKIRVLVLLASFPPSYESLVTALLVGKSTIKMDEVTAVILQNEILRRENSASSSDSGSLTLVTFEGAGGDRRSDRRS